MSDISFEALLQAEEEKTRNELRADAGVDKSTKQSVHRLGELYGGILLRYNAAHADEPLRQSAADSLTAAVRDELDLLLAGSAKKEITKRKFHPGGLIGLLFAVIAGLLAALLIDDYYIAGCVCILIAIVCGYLGGGLWYGERAVSVRTEIDADSVWRTLKKTSATMDRKIEEICAQAELLRDSGPDSARAAFSEEEILLFSDLMEALYSDNGEYALRQLKKVRAYLRQAGIEALDYSPEYADLFEVLPTKKNPGTQRPALVMDGKLLQVGRATATAAP